LSWSQNLTFWNCLKYKQADTLYNKPVYAFLSCLTNRAGRPSASTAAPVSAALHSRLEITEKAVPLAPAQFAALAALPWEALLRHMPQSPYSRLALAAALQELLPHTSSVRG
jgi:hypothetical protein